ncbi:MAG: hypothetical protein ACQESZ_09025 [Bacteroidota bacterium]
MTKTIDEIKKIRSVSPELQEKRKAYNRVKKQIKDSLKEGGKTIPELAKATGIDVHTITFTLMSMRKFHDVEVGEIDDMDEYFYYKLKQ